MNKRVVICSSMSNYNDVLSCKNYLEHNGVHCLIPEEDDKEKIGRLSSRTFQEYKRIVSRTYLTEIRRISTFGILVVNTPKRNIPNYIGANVFAEIAVAFNAKKKIFLYEDIYETYSDELLAWRAIPLRRDLSVLIEDYCSYVRQELSQLNLFKR